MNFIVKRNVLVTVAIVFIGSVQSVLNDLNSTHTTSVASGTTSADNVTHSKILSRRRRYVAFPEGSSFSVAFCATFGMIGNPELDYMSWALNWGVAYDLPNQTWIIEHRRQKVMSKPIAQRRHRRDLYNRLEAAIDNMGYNGRECVLRALCESAQFLYEEGTNMVEELVRIIFYMPSAKVLPFEHNDLNDYTEAHRMGKNKVYCSTAFAGCSISLVEMALGQFRKTFNFM